APAATAGRIGIDGPALEVFKISNDTAVGRLALCRVFGETLAEGTDLAAADGTIQRAGALFGIQGGNTMRLKQAEPGDIVGIAKADDVEAGERLGIGGIRPLARANGAARIANSALAIS